MLTRFSGFSFLLSLIAIPAISQNSKYTLSSDSIVNKQAGTKRVYYATKINVHPRIDGKLDDLCWQGLGWSGAFIQQTPSQGQSPSEPTDIKIVYDENYLYAAFKCYNHGPGKIRPILGPRDELIGDAVGIALDTYHDKQTAFEFMANASGQKSDLVHLGAYNFDYNWDAVWSAKTQVYDSLWTAEIRIPFSQLRFAQKPEQIWGMHVWRWLDRNKEESHWKLIPIDAPAMVYLFGELRGIEGIKPKVNYEFLPYLSMKLSPEGTNGDKFKYGAGLSGKIGVSSDFTVDYTINPDFGQVEADPSVLNLTSYEVFYDEKRPFFLEGNSIFDYTVGSDLLFYSRRIGHAPSYTPTLNEGETVSLPDNTAIISAIKLTGKTPKGLSVGVIQSFTAKENAQIRSTLGSREEVVEPFSNYAIGRIKQDFNHGNSTLGALITATNRDINDSNLNFLSTSAYSGGVDFQHNWKGRKYFIDVKSLFSQINGNEQAIRNLQLSSVHYFQRTDADYLNFDDSRTSLGGNGGAIRGGKRSGRFRANANFSWRSPGLELNDLGYLYQADILSEMLNLTYKVDKPWRYIRSYYIDFEQERDWNYGGDITLDRFKLHGYAQFKNLWSVHLNLKHYSNILDTRELRGGPALYKDGYADAELFIQSSPVKDLMIAAGPRFKWFRDNISQTDYFTFHVRWQVNNRLSITSRTIFDNSTDHHQYVKAQIINSKTNYLVGTIDRKTLQTTLRIEYFITPELSIQYYGNPYASIGKYRNFRFVADGRSHQLNQRYTNLNVLGLTDKYYSVDSNGDESVDFRFRDPDFNYQEFHSNFVARWEFKPGSALYLVWTHTRSDYQYEHENSIGKSFGDIWNAPANNIFMLKFSYWFSR